MVLQKNYKNIFHRLWHIMGWWLGTVVKHFIQSPKLLYDGPGWYCDG